MTWTSRSPARGTGITALQMDIKITGVSREIMQQALAQAKRARGAILDRMLEAIAGAADAAVRDTLRASRRVQINPEYIGMVIGKGGETIRSLESEYDVQIDIQEDGTILIYATSGMQADAAISAITALTKEPEVGDTYTGKVVKTTDFGAFVELKKGTDGLLHVSNVGPGPRQPHRGRARPWRHARRGRAGGRQGAWAASASSSSRSTRTAASSRRRSSSSGRRTPRRASPARSARVGDGDRGRGGRSGGGPRGPRREESRAD